MPATIILIADAVVAALNEHSFSLEFTAARRYVALADLPALAELTVTVMTRILAREVESRGSDAKTWSVDIGIQKRATGSESDKIAEYDTLMALVEEIVDFMARKEFTFPNVIVDTIENDPVYDFVGMKERSLFTSVITVNFENG